LPRPIWSGAISFGLVNVPVKLYSAVSSKDVRFHQLDAKSNARVKQKRVSAATGEEGPFDQIVKGYELGPDTYVTVTPDELDALDPKATKTIDIEDFVDLDQIDPVYFEHPYYLTPDPAAVRPYQLLVDAMTELRKVAIGRVVMRSKESLVAIRPVDGVLVMETMRYADEVLPATDVVPDADIADPSERELEMAKQLVESLSADFEPDKYHDEYREELLDLMAALEASLSRPGDAGPEEGEDLPPAAEFDTKPKKQTRRSRKSA